MIATSRTLEFFRDVVLGHGKTSTRPMWAYEVEMTRRNSEVYGKCTRNTRAVKALDRYYTIAVAIAWAIVMVLPSPTPAVHILSLLAPAILAAVCGGRMVARAAVPAAVLTTLFEAGLAAGHPEVLPTILVWLVVHVVIRGANELYAVFVRLLTDWSVNVCCTGYVDFRRGTGAYAHFPGLFNVLQALGLLMMFIVSWMGFTSSGVSYPFPLVIPQVVFHLCVMLPQAACAASVRASYDTMMTVRHRMWSGFKADIVDGKPVAKTLVVGSIVAAIAPALLVHLLPNAPFPPVQVLVEGAMSLGLTLVSLVAFPLWRALLSTAPSVGVVVTTPAHDGMYTSHSTR